MEQRENPEKTNAISNCVKQVENAKVRGYEPEARTNSQSSLSGGILRGAKAKKQVGPQAEPKPRKSRLVRSVT
jgi:hypothetical protein